MTTKANYPFPIDISTAIEICSLNEISYSNLNTYIEWYENDREVNWDYLEENTLN